MCAACEKLRSLLIIKTGYSRASAETRGKLRKQSAASENLVADKLRAPDISINSPDCGDIVCSKVGMIGSHRPDTSIPPPIDRPSIAGRSRSTSENAEERGRALKIIYARRNNHISRLRRRDDGARKIEKRGPEYQRAGWPIEN